MADLDPMVKRLARYILLAAIIFIIFYIMVKKVLGGFSGTPLA